MTGLDSNVWRGIWSPHEAPLCYNSPLIILNFHAMELNPIRNRIAELQERVASLRGYL